jgi:hypothetical protein
MCRPRTVNSNPTLSANCGSLAHHYGLRGCAQNRRHRWSPSGRGRPRRGVCLVRGGWEARLGVQLVLARTHQGREL